jgi:hypothetical protein
VVVAEKDPDAAYYPSEEAIQKFAKLAKKCDAVVLGNNLGSGIKRVKAIPREYRSRVHVVSFSPLKQDEKEEYEALGVKHFGIRELS